jgi:hypothetical protein
MNLADTIHQQVTNLPLKKPAEILDFVLLVEQRLQQAALIANDTARRQQLAAALKRLCELGTFAEVQDPVQWQREQRQDRPLLGRDD